MASFSAHSPAAVARDYVGSRQRTRPISISQAVHAIRTVLPECPLTDRELSDLAAGAAIESGFTVHFDLRADSPARALQPRSEPADLRASAVDSRQT